MRLKPAARLYLKLIAAGFALGVMFQTGVGVASHFAPRVTEIHIIQQPAAEVTGRITF